MSNKLQIVINDISPDVPVAPDEPTAPDIPNTGRFTALTTEPSVSSAGGEPTALAFPIVLFSFAFMLGLLALVLKRRKDKKMHLEFDGECEELDRNFNRRFYLSVIGCATLFVSAGLSFMFLDTSKDVSAEENPLTANGSDVTIEIDRNLADETTSYTVVEPTTVTITESTSHGYNLFAYIPSEFNYLSSTDEDNESVILPLFDEDGNPNTASRYGISLDSLGESFSIPAGKDNALLIDSVSEATEDEHTFTFNIEAIIDLDLPAGVYTGDIEFFAKRKNVITLDSNNATTLGSDSAIVAFDSSFVTPIVNPLRSYTISGFSTEHNNASGANVSSQNDIDYNYEFGNWYDSVVGGNEVIDGSGNLIADSGYADDEGRWSTSEDITLYAHWVNNPLTLPTITKTGHTCGWTTSSDSDTIMYASGATDFYPTEDTVFYGVCNINNYSVNVKTVHGIDSVALGSTSCASTSGCDISLTYGETYTLVATASTGYSFTGWNTDSYGTIANPSANSTTYTVSDGDDALVPSAAPNDYTITLNSNGASTAGSPLATVTFDSGDITSITNPSRSYTVSGFNAIGNHAIGATISSHDSLTYTYDFEQWYDSVDGGFAVIDDSGHLISGSGYADDEGRWVTPEDVTLYAHWFYSSITLPTIEKDDYACGWTTDTEATEIEYTSGSTDFHPDSDTVLYGVCVPPTIIFDGNGADEGSMDDISYVGVEAGDTIELVAPNFIKSGYGFVGWSFFADTTPGGAYAIYGPNETITVPDDVFDLVDDEGHIKLYAVWLESAGSLQSFVCESIQNIGDVTALTDERDGQTYAIAKLADDNCWMIENLRLNPADPNTNITMTNTNNPTSTFIETDVANVKSGIDTTLWKSCNEGSAACTDQISFGTGFITTSNPAKHIITDSDENPQSISWYSYGIMYNWYTATAGQGTYDTASYTTTEGDICPAGWHLPTGADNDDSTNDDEFGNLSEALGGLRTSMDQNTAPTAEEMSSMYRSFPNNFVNSGRYWATKAYSGTVSLYWSATFTYASENIISEAAGLGFDLHNMYPNNDSRNTYDGIAVRCIANPSHTLTVSYGEGVTGISIDGETVNNGDTVSLVEGTFHEIDATIEDGYEFLGWSATSGTIGSATSKTTSFTIGEEDASLAANAQEIKYYMQELTISQCAAYAGGQDFTVYDSRDESDYTVQLLGGRCWMTQNLRITGDIPAEGSNFHHSQYFNVSQDDLADQTRCTGHNASASNPAGYSNVCYKSGVDNEGNPTVWYNFAAATAGTITGYQNANQVTQDICPAGWRLPTANEQMALAYSLSSNASPFNPVYGGYYLNGNHAETNTYGRWWSSTPYTEEGNNGQFSRNGLFYRDGSLDSGYYSRFGGYYIRCVMDN
ncbi:InlB B-repeat-containing protein [Candidatus Saccharibacteria bacterium]|nr:InlB B-repeat-containing protein [Candidatus Saccharibacteria bacterium]